MQSSAETIEATCALFDDRVWLRLAWKFFVHKYDFTRGEWAETARAAENLQLLLQFADISVVIDKDVYDQLFAGTATRTKTLFFLLLTCQFSVFYATLLDETY